MTRNPQTLDELAQAIADAPHDDPGRPALGCLLHDLERLAGAELGGIRTDTVVLARRFARVHRLLHDAEPAGGIVGWLGEQRSPDVVVTPACA